MTDTVNDYIKKALNLAIKRHQQISSSGSQGLQSMYSSIVKQLEYLNDIVNGKKTSW